MEKEQKDLFKKANKSEEEIIELIKQQKEMTFYIETKEDNKEEKIIKEKITAISIYNPKEQETYYLPIEGKIEHLKEIFEDETIEKVSVDLTKIYILLKQEEINRQGRE